METGPGVGHSSPPPPPTTTTRSGTGGGGFTTTNNNNHPNNNTTATTSKLTLRARHRREDAVRRLVADLQEPHREAAATVASALDKRLDRELHAELVQEAKDNAGKIGQVCHDHAHVFLRSVAQVAALATPSADLADGLKDAQSELNVTTAEPMHQAASVWEEAKLSYARAKVVAITVTACQTVATHLERARKQANLGRPRAALRAVEDARMALTVPVESLFVSSSGGGQAAVWRDICQAEAKQQQYHHQLAAAVAGGGTATTMASAASPPGTMAAKLAAVALSQQQHIVNLEQTPFGKRAMVLLPRIETEVLQSAKRGLTRYLQALRSTDAAKAGRAALREAAHSASTGIGGLNLGGPDRSAFVWRAQMAENWIARAKLQDGKLARACRAAYFFDRDGIKDSESLDAVCSSTSASGSGPAGAGHGTTTTTSATSLAAAGGCERYAEAVATAFGWYRCWENDGSSLLIDPADYEDSLNNMDSSRGSRVSHASGSTTNSQGLSGSKHGRSRHGQGGKRSLGFRATTNSRSAAFQEMTSSLGTAANTAHRPSHNQTSMWAELLIPAMFLAKPAVCKDDDLMLRTLAESVHPVRRAEVAFRLLDKTEEFVQFYEKSRFGETKVGDSAAKSALAALTGDDVSVGTDRNFFAKLLPHLCASIAGFSAVESALEFSNFVEDDNNNGNNNSYYNNNASANNSHTNEEKMDSNADAAPNVGLQPSRFREISERYERTLTMELGNLIKSRLDRANLGELVRMSRLLVAFRAALKLVHPSSSSRRMDRELLNLEQDVLSAAVRIAQDEQLKATIAIVNDDQKVPMLVSESPLGRNRPPPAGPRGTNAVPDPETTGVPFGLSNMRQVPSQAAKQRQEQSRTSYNQAPLDEAFTFSHSVPVILRSIHARAIVCATFALTQMELGNKFPEKKGSAPAALVMECLEECVGSAVIAMKDSENSAEEGTVERTVQTMANISAVQHCLPRLFATVLRGLFHIGLVRVDEVDLTFHVAEKSLKAADKACDAQVGSTYSLVYEICRTKIDSHLHLGLEHFNWVAKSVRESPNPYCENLIGFLKSVFEALGPMDEGSRAGLHFSCCGHVSERLVKHLASKPGDTTMMDDGTLPPLTKIDAYGLKNLSLDCEAFEKFADSTGVPSLRDCFSEFKVLTSIMLDKDLPTLVLPEHATTRRRKYPLLSLEKVANMLEKYAGTGMFGGPVGRSDMLFIDKKEITSLLKIVRSQI